MLGYEEMKGNTLESPPRPYGWSKVDRAYCKLKVFMWTSLNECLDEFLILQHCQHCPKVFFSSSNYMSILQPPPSYSGFNRCHCTTVWRGFEIMSCQCFVSDAPEPFLPVNYMRKWGGKKEMVSVKPRVLKLNLRLNLTI